MTTGPVKFQTARNVLSIAMTWMRTLPVVSINCFYFWSILQINHVDVSSRSILEIFQIHTCCWNVHPFAGVLATNAEIVIMVFVLMRRRLLNVSTSFCISLFICFVFHSLQEDMSTDHIYLFFQAATVQGGVTQTQMKKRELMLKFVTSILWTGTSTTGAMDIFILSLFE